MNRLKRFLLKALWQDPQYEVGEVSCPTFLFDGIAPELYDKLLSEGNAAGVKFDGNRVTFKGCTFNWDYDAEAHTVAVTCTNRPIYLGCSTIKEHLQKLVDSARIAI